jgi:uncharacterized protein YjiS (DUF1127 family)
MNEEVWQRQRMLEFKLRTRIRIMWWAPPASAALTVLALYVTDMCWRSWQDSGSLLQLALAAANLASMAANIRLMCKELWIWCAGWVMLRQTRRELEQIDKQH